MKDNKIIHNASTDDGSSGSPIIRRSKDNYIIGLHYGGVKKNKNEYKFNLATLFDSILENIKEQNNIINCIYIPDNDITEINLLHNFYKDIKNWDKKDKKSYLEAKNNISDENIDIYVNDVKINFDFKYKIKDSKEIKVKFKLKKLLTNTSYMFYGCYSLESINLSSFNTTIVNNMSYMFYDCYSLKSIDLSSFDTTNVNNMSNMFYNCSSLKKENIKINNNNYQLLKQIEKDLK